jgi:hypothetical protein
MSSKLEKVKDEPNLVRDPFNKAILNTNNDALSAYKARRNKERKVETEINSLKQEMSDIKTLMQRILDKIG